MGQDAQTWRDTEDEGVGSPRATKSAVEAGDDGASWSPLLVAIGGVVLTLAILIVGLVPTWAVLSTVAVVLAAGAALAGMWWLLRPRPRPR